MKRYLILLLVSVILLSGCVDQNQKTVKKGDNITVDYVGSLQDGTVFDTSIKSVAEENNITKPDYKPLPFTVGKGRVIKGFDEGVVGMKVGESKTLTISPENGYGPINPQLIQASPIIYNESTTADVPKILNVTKSQFEGTFGTTYKVSDEVKEPGTNVNLTILNISDVVTLSRNVKKGDKIVSEGWPWNETVEKVDEKNITIRHNAKKNSTIQFPNTPWNTTVIDVSNDNITLKQNAIPDTEVQTMFGRIKVHFNETHIIMDRNHELAGKTLIFNVTVRSIGK